MIRIVTALLVGNAVGRRLSEADGLKNEGSGWSGLSWSEWVLLLLAVGGGLALYDRRNGYRYLNELRSLMGEVVIRWRNLKNRKTEINEKLSTEDSLTTTKRNLEVYDTEKTYIEADLSSIMQEHAPHAQSEQAMALELEPEVPRVNLKEIFEKKESKSKHKTNKSKSKIRSRVMNKASEESENEKEEETVEENSLTEENSFNGDNSLDLDPAPAHE